MPDNETNAGSDGRDGGGAISLGERLSSARNARAISLEQAARTLHLDKTVVAALEAEQFEALGAAVFVKGHLRSYAELLGLPPDDVIEAYRQLDPTIDELPATVEKQQLSERVNVALWSFWAMVIVAAMLVAVYLYEGATDREAGRIRQQRLAPNEPAPAVIGGTEARQQAAEPVDNTLPPPSTDPVRGAGAASPPSATEDRGMADPVPEPVPAPEPVAPAPESLAAATAEPTERAPTTPEFAVVRAPAISGLAAVDPDRTRLSLIFSEDSWVEITDATGRRILYGLQRGGARRELSGEPPVVVFLGNASGVEVLVDGSEYSISSGARRGNTARFEIQPEIQP